MSSRHGPGTVPSASSSRRSLGTQWPDVNTAAPLTIAPDGPVTFGPFVLDAAQARLCRDGQPMPLGGRPLAVLALLAAHPGQLLTKGAVLDAVWGHRHVTESALKGAVNLLRAALGDDVKTPHFIETVPRLGYRFVAAVAAVAAVKIVSAPPSAPAGPVTSGSPPATPAARESLPPGNLPPQQAGLVGRDADLSALQVALQHHRLVTMSGLGGVGKTRLALAWAAQAAPHDGAWLVRLEDLDEAALLVPLVAQTLLLGPGAAAGVEALGRALQPMRLLLVLDNADHLVDAVAGLVNTLLLSAPALRVLVTSQLPLRLACEQVLPLAPLDLPADVADSAPAPESYAAARLFCQGVRHLQPDWAARVEDHAHIAAICRALDGVPLALELAAARVPLLGVAGVRSRLDQRFALLTSAPRDAAQRHRTLAAALDWTFGLLTPAERGSLHRLAVFVGDFSAEAAEAVLAGSAVAPAGQALDLLERLRACSLLAHAPGPGGMRLRLFDSVRRYALDDGARHGVLAEAQCRHLAWMRQCFEAIEHTEFHTPLLHWLPLARRDIDNLRAALRHGLQADAADAQREDALCLLAATAMFWYRSGNRREGWKWLQAGQALPASAHTSVLLDHAVGVFSAFAQMALPALGIEALQRSRAALVEAGDHRRCYMSLYSEALMRPRLASNFDPSAMIAEMHRWAEDSWGTFERRHVHMVEASMLRRQGSMDTYVQVSARLANACRAAGALAESWPHDNGQAQGLTVLGRLDEASALLQRALVEIRAAGLLREQVSLLAIAASVALRRDGSATGIALAREALLLLQADDMAWWMADALPWAAWHAGRSADAARLQAWADALMTVRGDARGPFFGALREALVQALQGHAQAAALQAVLCKPPELTLAAAVDLALGA